MNENNTVEELVHIQKQNQELLKMIAESQTMMLALARENRDLEKRKIWLGAGKYLFWVVMILLSFVFTQKLTQNLMGGAAGAPQSASSSFSGLNLDNLLNGGVDAELQQELDRYLGE